MCFYVWFNLFQHVIKNIVEIRQCQWLIDYKATVKLSIFFLGFEKGYTVLSAYVIVTLGIVDFLQKQ